MPIPEEHMKNLKNDLIVHKKRLLNLQRDIKHIQEEIDVHEMILELGNDEKIIAVLNELYEKPKLVKNIIKDTNTFFEKRGAIIPPNATLFVKSKDEKSVVVEAHFKQGPYVFKMIWDSNKGFSLVPLEDQHLDTPE